MQLVCIIHDDERWGTQSLVLFADTKGITNLDGSAACVMTVAEDVGGRQQVFLGHQELM